MSFLFLFILTSSYMCLLLFFRRAQFPQGRRAQDEDFRPCYRSDSDSGSDSDLFPTPPPPPPKPPQASPPPGSPTVFVLFWYVFFLLLSYCCYYVCSHRMLMKRLTMMMMKRLMMKRTLLLPIWPIFPLLCPLSIKYRSSG